MNWQRRPTEAEIADVIAAEEARRAVLLVLADPQLPPPEFGPLPTGDGMTRTVYACGAHAISLDGASLVHKSTCTAPNPADLPGCNCVPEPSVPTPPGEATPPNLLPDHWVVGA
ncbi:hypothetical protein ABZ454_38790 [Streptomyces sp. NPDC005803]|uniref:hypothetical protein n=1 Tax=Streptomyces sp. NPDC005803 TaxID=3154297 RepID=UPI0033DF5D9D